MKNQNTGRYFVLCCLKKTLIFIALIFCIISAGFATSYTVSANINASALSTRTEDTLYVDAVVTISSNETWNFTTVFMRGGNGTIFWSNNSNLSLPNCTVFNIQTGASGSPGLLPTHDNASKVLIIAGVKVAVANDNSNNAAFSFEEFTDLGGLPKFTITSNSPVCNGSALSITATPDRSSSILFNYNWTISPVSGTFSPSSSNSSTSTATSISPSSGSYTITCKIYATGDLLATVTSNVTVNALPSIPGSTSASPAVICAGGSCGLNATAVGNTIQWFTASAGGTNFGTSPSGSNLTVTPLSTTTYYAEALSAFGCKSASRSSVTATVNPLPVLYSVTGGGSYCSGGSGVAIGLSGSQPGVNYQLYNGGSITGSTVTGTGSAISFGNKTAAGTYTVAATNATTNCTTVMTGNASVAIITRPASVVGPASQSICKGNNALINVALSGTPPWSISYSDGSSSTIISGINTNAYSFNVSPNSSKTYTITALADATCTAVSADRTGSAGVTVNPRPTGTLSGSASICKGTSAQLNLAVTGSGIISGTLSNGISFTGSAPNIIVSASPLTAASYSISTLNNGTCASSVADLSGTYAVTVIDPVIISVDEQPAATTFCAGSNTTFSVNASGTSILNYKWQVSTNGNLYTDVSGNGYTGANTSSLNVVEPSASMNGNNYRIIVTSPASCAVSATSSPAKLLLRNYWTGLVSTDWNTPGNWSGNTVPTLGCADVYISDNAPFQPVVTSGTTVTVNNLIIKPGSQLIVNGILQVAGTITNAGMFDVTNGTLEYNGSSAQSIAANLFFNNTIKDLTISNDVSVDGTLNLTGTLSFGSSGKIFAANGNLTLRSSAASTAIVGPVINGNNITGDVTVERYISAKRAWRFLAVPTQSLQTVKTAWQESALTSTDNFVNGYGTQVTNNTATWQADGFDYYSQDGPSLEKYDPVKSKYIGVANTSVKLASKEGWMIFVRGDRSSVGLSGASTSTVLRTKGNLYMGTQSTITVPAGQFTSIANPYASPLDMTKILKTGILNTFYVWDPNLGSGGGGFQTFNPGADGNYRPVPGNGSYPPPSVPYNYIHSGEAFFVAGIAAPAPAGSITITEDAKASSASGLVFRPVADIGESSLRTNLYSRDDKTALSLIDGTLNLFSDKYSKAAGIADAKKILVFNPAENISIKTNGQLLAVEKRNIIKHNDTIHLHTENLQLKSYRLEFTALNFDKTLTAFLEDTYNNNLTELNINGTSVYDFTVINTGASLNAERFRIVFTQKQITSTSGFPDFLKPGKDLPAITVYPNPVNDGNINLQFINQPKGTYVIRLLNKAGQVVMLKQIEHTEGSGKATFSLHKNMPHETYHVDVTKPDNSKVMLNILN